MHGQGEREQRARGLEVAGLGSQHRRKDVEDVGPAVDEREPRFHGALRWS